MVSIGYFEATRGYVWSRGDMCEHISPRDLKMTYLYSTWMMRLTGGTMTNRCFCYIRGKYIRGNMNSLFCYCCRGLLNIFTKTTKENESRGMEWNVIYFIFPLWPLGTWENILLNRTCTTFYLSFRRVAATFGFVEQSLAFALSELSTIILGCLSLGFLFQGSL